jgi:sugar/nucleoside kinase (ribokinase family)
MTKTTVCFGEIMLRLGPPGFERFLQTPQFVATFGGGEANVAVALAQFGLPAAYVTVLPDKNPIAVRRARSKRGSPPPVHSMARPLARRQPKKVP